MHPRQRRIALALLFISLLAMTLAAAAVAQDAPTPTPLPINLSTAVPPEATENSLTAPEVSEGTAPQTAAQLEARDVANVRAQPDTGAARLGEIRAGEQYVVVGRYFQWYQFQFDPSPNGLGWVFADLVNIIGDESLIPEIDLAAEPTLDPNALALTATREAITQTPGGLLTATANAAQQAGGVGQITPPGLLPTFTYPPNLLGAVPGASSAQPAATEALEPANAVVEETETGGIPPLLPIAVLIGLGVIGLALSGMRRG